MLHNTPNQPANSRTKNWTEINYDVRGTYNKDSQIEFKTSMLNWSLCDYSDAYILVMGTISVVEAGADDAGEAANRNNKQAIFKNCAPFTDCTTGVKNTEVDNAKAVDVAVPIYNLIEYSDNYLKTSGN